MKLLFLFLLSMPAFGAQSLASLNYVQRHQANSMGLSDGTGQCAGMYQNRFNVCFQLGEDGQFQRAAIGGGYSGARRNGVASYTDYFQGVQERTVEADNDNISDSDASQDARSGSTELPIVPVAASVAGQVHNNPAPAAANVTPAPAAATSSPVPAAAIVNPAPAPETATPAPVVAEVNPAPTDPDAQATDVTTDSEARAPAAGETPAPEIADQETLDDKFENFDADSCAWVEDMPRKVHEAPGCGRGRTTKLCVGYVVCNRTSGGGKFIRASTCGENNCGDAVACTKDAHYWSSPASESDQKYIHRDIRDLIERRGQSSGATQL